jgi:hypothetical protein
LYSSSFDDNSDLGHMPDTEPATFIWFNTIAERTERRGLNSRIYGSLTGKALTQAQNHFKQYRYQPKGFIRTRFGKEYGSLIIDAKISFILN